MKLILFTPVEQRIYVYEHDINVIYYIIENRNAFLMLKPVIRFSIKYYSLLIYHSLLK